MNLAQINSKITRLTGADTTEFPNSERVVDLNIWKQKITGMIIDSQDISDYDDQDHGDNPIIETPLVSGQRDYNFGVGEGIIELRQVNVTYDGSKWYRSTPIELADMEGIGIGEGYNDSTVDGNFDKSAPRHDFRGMGLFLYPEANATDVSNGGKLQVQVTRAAKDYEESDITTGTDVPSFDPNFHHMLAYGVAFEYALMNNLENKDEIEKLLLEEEARLRKQYGRKQRDQVQYFDSVISDKDYE